MLLSLRVPRRILFALRAPEWVSPSALVLVLVSAYLSVKAPWMNQSRVQDVRSRRSSFLYFRFCRNSNNPRETFQHIRKMKKQAAQRV